MSAILNIVIKFVLKRIIIIDNNADLLNYLQSEFQKEGYDTRVFGNSLEFLNSIYNNKADVFITELDFSTIDGKSLVSTIHEVYPDVPLIILTKEADSALVVETFKLGADDYVTKPFDFQVLLARVKARLHEYQNNIDLLYRDIKFDVDKKLVYKGNKRLVLSSKEYHLLLYLIQNKGRVITRDELLDRVWEMEKFISTRSVDVYIGRLRKKIGDAYIRTRRGFGYLLND